jgi:hypothetical protein
MECFYQSLYHREYFFFRYHHCLLSIFMKQFLPLHCGVKYGKHRFGIYQYAYPFYSASIGFPLPCLKALTSCSLLTPQARLFPGLGCS